MRSSATLLALALSPLALAQSAGQPPVTEPLIVDGKLVFPDNNAIPRSLTPAERLWLDANA
ncbi:MAG: hypothetical protein JNL50_03290, partial [Phycisphaerae bacterium]|nr:hypothetical protein [Phycisphaerae bacterium]